MNTKRVGSRETQYEFWIQNFGTSRGAFFPFLQVMPSITRMHAFNASAPIGAAGRKGVDGGDELDRPDGSPD